MVMDLKIYADFCCVLILICRPPYVDKQHTVGLGHGRNGLEDIKVVPVEKKLAQYEQEWLNHTSRMEDIGYPKQLIQSRRIGGGGRRRRIRPLEILLDGNIPEGEISTLLA
jgi:hypothetical protein